MAPWPSGKAKVCNTSIPSPNLGGASKKRIAPIRVLFFFCSHSPIGLCFCALAHKIQFANSTKERSVLAQELLGEFSSRQRTLWVAPIRVLFFFCSHSSVGQCFCASTHKIQFANSTKERSVLAQELLGEFSSQ